MIFSLFFNALYTKSGGFRTFVPIRPKSKGIKFGRQNRLSKQQQTQLHQDRTDGLLIRELMQKYNLSKASVYRYLGTDVKL